MILYSVAPFAIIVSSFVGVSIALSALVVVSSVVVGGVLHEIKERAVSTNAATKIKIFDFIVFPFVKMNKICENQSFGRIGISNPSSRDGASSNGEDETLVPLSVFEGSFSHPKRKNTAKTAEKIKSNAFFISSPHTIFFG